MVTFVSQCEKKALNKTRRVLDAFANRIGDNTWQTVITNEGLLAVKKLLRKTASKNTAVSCHWLRSRSRSEMVWIVGSKSQFNFEGIVPVNSTQKEVPMDIKRDRPIKGVNYANTQLQRLDYHLFAVGYVAQQLYKWLYPQESKRKYSDAVFIAGCLHDIGKIDPNFQTWVTKDKNKTFIAHDGQHISDGKFSFEKYPRHNEISVLLYELMDHSGLKTLNTENKKRIKNAVYWHHAKPFRREDIFEVYGDIYKTLDKNLKGEAWSLVVEKSRLLLDLVSKIECSYHEKEDSSLQKCLLLKVDNDRLDDIESKKLPTYKEYDEGSTLQDFQSSVRKNAINNEIRACLITADRWVSSLPAEELANSIKQRSLDDFIKTQIDLQQLNPESALSENIVECIKSFPSSDRSNQQSAVAKKLADNFKQVNVLAGAAGCGKTKIALEWAQLRQSQQIIWICPRVQICQGLFNDLSCSDKPYLPNATIELHTGEYKYTNSYDRKTPEQDYFTGDIVITTIDQILSNIISHTRADRLLNYLNVHVVFDEYHEYVNMPAFNLLFAELVASRSELATGANALLVSATPHYAYINQLLDLDSDYDVIEMPSFNDCKYQFDFQTYDETQQNESNPLYQRQDESTFVISNTAITAQKSFIKNQHHENAILLHSKFKKNDKKQLFNQVFEAFKREGTRQFHLLRSGPIVQASLNISCDYMVSEITTAENCLQRLGRLDRFGLNSTGINKYTIAIPESLHEGRGTGLLARFLSSTNSLASTKEWYEFLRQSTSDGAEVLTLHEIYKIYKEFYHNSPESNVHKFINSDLLAAMKKSASLVQSKLAQPQTIVRPKNATSARSKLGKNSLRGDSRFVQMAVWDIQHYPIISFPEQYAYEIPTNEVDNIDNLTLSCEAIQGYGDSTKNLLAHMHKKHHNILGGKKSYKDFILLNEATDPEFPIYLSYTPNDLLPVGGESARHSEAMYYAVCDKQPVGAILFKQLSNQET
jgi:CRISPR-associated endonuclease/helicase Cas3